MDIALKYGHGHAALTWTYVKQGNEKLGGECKQKIGREI
jgi:hypothetical protein